MEFSVYSYSNIELSLMSPSASSDASTNFASRTSESPYPPEYDVERIYLDDSFGDEAYFEPGRKTTQFIQDYRELFKSNHSEEYEKSSQALPLEVLRETEVHESSTFQKHEFVEDRLTAEEERRMAAFIKKKKIGSKMRFICGISGCHGKPFYCSTTNIKNHLQTCHIQDISLPGEKSLRFLCVKEGCQKRFTSKSNARRHVTTMNAGKTRKCEDCGQHFTRSDYVHTQHQKHCKSRKDLLANNL